MIWIIAEPSLFVSAGKLGAPSTNQEQRSYYYEVGRLSRSQVATHALSSAPPPSPNHALKDAIEAPRHLYLRHRCSLWYGRRLNDIGGLDGTTAEPFSLPVPADYRGEPDGRRRRLRVFLGAMPLDGIPSSDDVRQFADHR